MNPQPPGPGFPLHAPSVKRCTFGAGGVELMLFRVLGEVVWKMRTWRVARDGIVERQAEGDRVCQELHLPRDASGLPFNEKGLCHMPSDLFGR